MNDERIFAWLASGDVGTSSKSIMLWLSAKQVDRTWGASTPSDPADLRRCMNLLRCVPEWRGRMGEMAEAGGLWPTFSRRWDEMERSFLEEVGGSLPDRHADWSAPKTYALMKSVHAEAYATDNPNFTQVKGTGKLAGTTMTFAKGSPLAEAIAAQMQKRAGK